MGYTTLSYWGPEATPSTLKQLALFTIILSLLSGLIQSILNAFGLIAGPQDLLSLSWWGIGNGYLWEPLTYLFVHELPYQGMTFYYFIGLLFDAYLIWTLGSAIFALIGKGPFLRLYFLSGVAAGLISLFVMALTGQYIALMGPAASLLALLMVWNMAFPERELMVFFILPVKAKWAIAGIVSYLLLSTLSQWNLPYFFLYLTSLLIGYIYAAMAWGWSTPYPFTQKADRWLASVGLRLRPYLPKWSKVVNTTANKESIKIIDLRTGDPLAEDDAFVDAMLTKISKKGEGSLSWSEKKRLQQISEKKMRDNKN